jgi:hypothetical protein
MKSAPEMIDHMRELLDELEEGITTPATYSLLGAYDSLKQAVRRTRCNDLEDDNNE